MTHDKQDAFRDELNICNEGRTRYILPPTYPSLHALNVEFSSAVCQLPIVYNQATYRQFLDLWGTVSKGIHFNCTKTTFYIDKRIA